MNGPKRDLFASLALLNADGHCARALLEFLCEGVPPENMADTVRALAETAETLAVELRAHAEILTAARDAR